MVIHDMRNPINAVISQTDQISKELDQEFSRISKIRKIFSGKELEAVSVIQKVMELSDLNQ